MQQSIPLLDSSIFKKIGSPGVGTVTSDQFLGPLHFTGPCLAGAGKVPGLWAQTAHQLWNSTWDMVTKIRCLLFETQVR